jgi:hypothetical protein
MKQVWMSGAAVVMAMGMATVGAQTPQNPPQQTQPPTQTTRPAAPQMQNDATATVTGCVYKEAAVPGRTPNVAERAGVLEDYILVASTDAASATAGTTGTTPPATAGTTGAAPMLKHKAFKLEHMDDEKLKAMVGKRVEVTGKIDAESGDTANRPAATGTTGAPATDRSAGPDKIELPEFEVTSIREVAGTCPTTPDIKK